MKEKLNTTVFWQLTNYCTAGCSYCPSHFWSGEKYRELSDYLYATNLIIDNYKKMNRTINWIFTGGELLEVFDFPAVLKLCKENGGTTSIETNGGKLWLDWWAIEPNVDSLHLTYHYWQNPNLIKFIVQAFKNKDKSFTISIPLRETHFDEDLKRGKILESEEGVSINYRALFDQADPNIGMHKYTDMQLEFLFGKEWVENRHKEPVTFAEKKEHIVNISPSFTGKLCNVGIEYLRISPEGWVSGSNCNNSHLGNLWNGSLSLPTGPAVCKMQACTDNEDQQITKFD